ncbi:ProQ/FINO family protein [Ideonella oryzae]|uniref:ProQ/FINO family protein n=1 Tax=Ideonella oryzae TaxID=2937441 RepID=A0ABT1BME7_9BURK|nr:ProQ/FINO family protein [Ideonella oryzae]MCO5977402.1 ProQ/FINO family protein [Ideonella oryzae]
MSMTSMPTPPAADQPTLPVADALAPSAAAPAPSDLAPDTPVPAAPAEVSPPSAAPAMSTAECAEQLKQRFPALFAGAPKPIKLRVQADIQARAPGVFTKAVLSAVLRRHTGGTGYLIALSKASHRLDLDGQPTDPVSDEHRQAALDELARRRAITQARRAEEDQARRDRAHLLRDFEKTTLTEANFCALKGLTPEQLQATLAQARQEAAEAPPREMRHDGRGPRPDGRGPREGGRPDRPFNQDRAARGAGGPRNRGNNGPKAGGPR